MGIKGLINLRSLDISFNSMITDSCVKGLSNLSELNLRYNSMITDSGIKGLKDLRSLDLCGSKITMKMKKKLKKDGVKVINW